MDKNKVTNIKQPPLLAALGNCCVSPWVNPVSFSSPGSSNTLSTPEHSSASPGLPPDHTSTQHTTNVFPATHSPTLYVPTVHLSGKDRTQTVQLQRAPGSLWLKRVNAQGTCGQCVGVGQCSAQWEPLYHVGYLHTKLEQNLEGEPVGQKHQHFKEPSSLGSLSCTEYAKNVFFKDLFLHLIWLSILLPQTQCFNFRSSIPLATKYQIIHIYTSCIYKDTDNLN